MAAGRSAIRLVVLFGGQSAEHDVSCVTARHVLAAADPERYRIVPVGITREGQWVQADEASRALAAGAAGLPDALAPEGRALEPVHAVAPSHPDETVVVLPLLHGPLGEDGTVQGLLELAGVPYVGSGVFGSAAAMHKAKAKELIAHAGIPQGLFRSFRVGVSHPTDKTVDELGGYPVFVKPAHMGSSIGVSKVHDASELDPAFELAASYDEWVLIEETIVGREIEVGVLGDLAPEASVPGEVRSASEFYDYEDKYLDGRAELIIPAALDPEQTDEIRSLALQAFTALDCEGLARVDFFYEPDGRGFLLNEVNTIPGFTPFSMYPKLWEATGLGYADLIDRLVDLAIARHERRRAQRGASRRPSLHRAADAPGPDEG
jgi:D-alanine-D-alanine ligase